MQPESQWIKPHYDTVRPILESMGFKETLDSRINCNVVLYRGSFKQDWLIALSPTTDQRLSTYIFTYLKDYSGSIISPEGDKVTRRCLFEGTIDATNAEAARVILESTVGQ